MAAMTDPNIMAAAGAADRLRSRLSLSDLDTDVSRAANAVRWMTDFQLTEMRCDARAVLDERAALAARNAEMEFDHMLARRQAVLEVMGERDHWRSLAAAAQARVGQLESDRDEDTRVFARWTGAVDGSDEERAAAALAVRIADRVTGLADRTAPVPCVYYDQPGHTPDQRPEPVGPGRGMDERPMCPGCEAVARADETGARS